MKKILPAISGAMFGVFMLGVFAIVMSLSYQALGYVFPGQLLNQLIGLALFDVSALVWFMAFVYLCASTGQYVVAAFGFLLGLAGVIGLVVIEVGISSGQVAVAAVMRPLTYVFIAAAVGHLVLIYLHHGAAPDVENKINMGVEKAKIHAEGMRQAENTLDGLRVQMGETIRARLVAEVYRDMNLEPQVIEGKLLPVDDSLDVSKNGWPVAEAKPTQRPFLASVAGLWGKWSQPAAGAPVEASPSAKSSTAREQTRTAAGRTVDAKLKGSASSAEPDILEACGVEPAQASADSQPTGDGQK